MPAGPWTVWLSFPDSRSYPETRIEAGAGKRRPYRSVETTM